eukprot:12932333-Prorocentrum_lima.AAC.1
MQQHVKQLTDEMVHKENETTIHTKTRLLRGIESYLPEASIKNGAVQRPQGPVQRGEGQEH